MAMWLERGLARKFYAFFFFLMTRHPPRSPLFPYTPLSRSAVASPRRVDVDPAAVSGARSVEPDLAGAPRRAHGGARSRPRPHRISAHHRHAAADDVLRTDRKSTRLNSSHSQISYAVFCLKK